MRVLAFSHSFPALPFTYYSPFSAHTIPRPNTPLTPISSIKISNTLIHPQNQPPNPNSRRNSIRMNWVRSSIPNHAHTMHHYSPSNIRHCPDAEEDALDVLRSFRPDPDLPQDSQDQDIKPVLPESIRQDSETKVKIEGLHTNTAPGMPHFSYLLTHPRWDWLTETRPRIPTFNSAP